MCHRSDQRTYWCAEHTEPVYVLALAGAQQHYPAADRIAHVFSVAKDFAATSEGQARLARDQYSLHEAGYPALATVINDARELGLHQLREIQHHQSVQLHDLRREITRLWAGVVPTSDAVLSAYVTRAASELNRSVESTLRLVHQRIASDGLIDRHHPRAHRALSWDSRGTSGSPVTPEALSMVFYLEEMTAHARAGTRLTAELPDPAPITPSFWQQYDLPTGRSMHYNPVRAELLLPEVDVDSPPRQFRGVDASLAFAVASARRPGLLVAAAFFPARDGNLDHRTAQEFSFAHALANEVYPLGASTGPAPERILPEPVRASVSGQHR